MRDRRDSARKLAAVLAVPLLISSGHLAAAQPNDGKPDPPALAVKDEMILSRQGGCRSLWCRLQRMDRG
jgi:hypothetical protein